LGFRRSIVRRWLAISLRHRIATALNLVGRRLRRGFCCVELRLRFASLGFRFASSCFRSLQFLSAIFRFGLLARFDYRIPIE
jgi:hypothetical protein